VIAAQVVARLGDGGTLYSSTRLLVDWSAAAGSFSRYRVTASEGVTATPVTAVVDAPATSTTLTNLKSGTEYTLRVAGCLDSACSTTTVGGSSVSATTEAEVWQLEGSTSADSYSSGTLVVSDGNTKPYVIQYPESAGAPAALEGKVRFYYDAANINRKGISVGLSENVATALPSSVSSFVSEGSGAGIFRPTSNTTYINSTHGVATSQAIPLPASMGTKIRMYFEAAGADSKTRILFIDSQDGYLGVDFNSGSATTCQTAEDYASGGCVPLVAVGVVADGAGTGLTQARQFKVGYPVLTSWIWDGSIGTFMVITAEDACGTTTNGLTYATWSGSAWLVEQTPAGGCARFMVNSGHGPVVVHLGGVRYKLYYEDSTDGNIDKPLHVIYADGALTGDTTKVEIDDWESEASAREVNFIWPSGNPLSASNESGLGDHVIYSPTGSLDNQVMYMNLGGMDDPTWMAASTGLGMAVLVNP
jgi:hypothetical protein